MISRVSCCAFTKLMNLCSFGGESLNDERRRFNPVRVALSSNLIASSAWSRFCSGTRGVARFGLSGLDQRRALALPIAAAHPMARSQAVQHPQQPVGFYHLPVRKREVRQFARLGSLAAAALLLLNVLLFHSVLNLAWAATVMLIVVAVGNLLAAFADELSARSFFASITDLMLAGMAAVTFLLQAGAAEIDSKALSYGMHLFAVVLELLVVGLNMGLSLIGQVSDEVLEPQKAK